MPNEEGRRTDDTRMVIKALAWYLHRGYPLKVHEPMVRGSEGPSRDSLREISFTIQGPTDVREHQVGTHQGRAEEARHVTMKATASRASINEARERSAGAHAQAIC